MKHVYFDTETYPIQTRGKATLCQSPRMVCAQWLIESPDDPDPEPIVELRAPAAERFCVLVDEALETNEVEFLALNAVYDVLVLTRLVFEETGRDVLPEVFALYEAGLVTDVQIRAKLQDIRDGRFWRGYSLAALLKRETGISMSGKSGDDPWRMRYNELDGVDPARWPDDAYDYAAFDPKATQLLANALEDFGAVERFFAVKDFWLGLASGWGLRIDQDFALEVDTYYEEEEARWFDVLSYEETPAGKKPRKIGRPGWKDDEMLPFVEGGTMKDDAKRLLFEMAFEEIGEQPWRTDSGLVSADKKTIAYLEEQNVEEPLFQAFKRYNKASTFRTVYLEPILDAGDDPICTRFDSLKRTGRLSASKPNTTNMPARSTAEERARRKQDPDAIIGSDIRRCFVPRDGYVYTGADYQAIELAALSQVYYSLTGQMGAMGDAINSGKDLHCYAASVGIGISYEEAMFRRFLGSDEHANGDLDRAREMAVGIGAKEREVEQWISAAGGFEALMDLAKEFGRTRSTYKIANFSFPTGATADTFVVQARAQGLRITPPQAEYVRERWFSAWWEMSHYKEIIASHKDFASGCYDVPHIGPNGTPHGWRTRRCDRLTSAANSPFQGLAADGISWAGWLITKECYLEEYADSPLYGSRIVLCVHDELVLEVPEERAQAVLDRQIELMLDGMNLFIPDVRTHAEGKIMPDCWVK